MRVTPDLLHSQIVTSCLLHSHHSQVLTSSIDMLILSLSKLDSCFFLLNFHEQESWRHSKKHKIILSPPHANVKFFLRSNLVTNEKLMILIVYQI